MTQKALQTIDDSGFIEQIILQKSDALVKFSSPWSWSGQLLDQTLMDLAGEYDGKVRFYAVDYDEHSALSATYRLEAVPTLLFFKKGSLVDRLSGLAHKEVIANKIDRLINI
ncbi:MAG: thioredoxin family protein [Bacteroidota bacterium]